MTFGGGNTGMTLGSMSGRYTKIGRQVFCCLRFNLPTKGSSTGILEFQGLPFTVGDVMGTTAVQGGFFIGFFSGHSSGIHEVAAYPWEDTTVLKVYKRVNENSAPNAFEDSDIAGTLDGRISFFYMVAQTELCL